MTKLLRTTKHRATGDTKEWMVINGTTHSTTDVMVPSTPFTVSPDLNFTSLQTSQNQHPHEAPVHVDQHPLAGLASAPARHRKRTPFDSSSVRYTRSWLVLGLGVAILALLAVWHYGPPVAVGMAALGLAILAYMGIVEPARPTLEHITLHLPTLPPELDGLRVGQITDPHLGMPYSAYNLRWAVEQMQRERPEVVVLTGDFVSQRAAIPSISSLLCGLTAPLGVYAVLGNHDYDYWEGIADIHEELARLDIPLLINEHRRLRWNGADLWLVGIDDEWDGRPDLSTALHGVPRGTFTLLLAHEPDIADQAAQRGIAVQLSGHTHGGHLRLPFLGPFALPRFGWRYDMGHYQIGKLALYVSRGLGGSPLRLFCRPEVTIFTLRRDWRSVGASLGPASL